MRATTTTVIQRSQKQQAKSGVQRGVKEPLRMGVVHSYELQMCPDARETDGDAAAEEDVRQRAN